ncbi:MAG: 4-hydroxybutyrate--acetyl-CoA CoA transferase, partial [Clostridia bacterium]|nr:4-hydroxybutyrate--acetyl-CoA CoA transferase [Clostridia bacterium]
AFMNKKDLGIHTEMITSSMADLCLAGVVNGSKKTLHRGKLIGGFASGNQKLVDYLTENPSVYLMPLEYTNHPAVVAQNYKMCSINTCIEVDLTGQIASESIGPRQFSGSGGQNDTAEGAIHGQGGKSIIAFASAITKKDGTRVSKIKSILTPGSIVTLSRNNIDYIVTEYGIAPMKARSIRQRVDNLIAVAHPDFREQLRAEANKLMLW